MKMKITCALLLSFALLKGWAQQPSITTDVAKVTFLNPGLSYEKSITQKGTLQAHAYLAPRIWFSYFTSTNGAGIHADLDPTLQVQYRYYYNHKQRQAKEKRTEKNSLNYISPTISATYTKHLLDGDLPPQNERHGQYSLGLLWGMQRNYQKRFSLDLSAGLQYSFSRVHLQSNDRPITFTDNAFVPVVAIQLGFWLNRE